MCRWRNGICALLFCSGIVGCGPMGATPLPTRLDEENQKIVDDAWGRAFGPMQQLDRQGLLDFILSVYGYQLGVDRLEFRSEKTVADGIVVMSVRYDRQHPETDRFEIQLLDSTGEKLRSEGFNREEIDAVSKDFATTLNTLRQHREQKIASPAELAQLDLLEARVVAVNQILQPATADSPIDPKTAQIGQIKPPPAAEEKSEPAVVPEPK